MRLLNKTQMNFAYGMGAAVVIIGALVIALAVISAPR